MKKTIKQLEEELEKERMTPHFLKRRLKTLFCIHSWKYWETHRGRPSRYCDKCPLNQYKTVISRFGWSKSVWKSIK